MMKLLQVIKHSFFPPQPDESDEIDPYVIQRRIDLGPPKPGHESRPDWGIKEWKGFSALVRETPELPSVKQYLMSISDLQFHERSSESLYTGDYLSGRGTNLNATIVPVMQLAWIPKRLRKPGWVYVSIRYPTDDTRFDYLPRYEVLPARQYTRNAGGFWGF